MTTATPAVAQAPRLTTDQIAQFKREGYLVLPGVVDPELCRQARDQMWDTIAQYRPSMRRDDPSTWTPISEEENASYTREATGGDPYFGGGGHRFYIRNGAEDLLLDIGARVVWDVAEQLLGEGEVVYPAGLDATGHTTGPCYLTEGAVKGMESHLGDKTREWTGPPTNRTGPLRLPKTGPHWVTGQGTRGMYCTLPNGSPRGPNYPSAHSGEGMGSESRWKVQTAVYFDDLPLGAGGLHLWPGSHARVWEAYRELKQSGSGGTYDGYNHPVVADIKADTEPVDTHGPAGSVVLWHSIMLHMAGVNTSSDIIRQATLYAFAKTPESMPDESVENETLDDIWADWSDEVRAVAV
ncbi:MAG: phytanoyl-CoA dioxygenase family protein [Chloroflexota bacterium]|nr:phytanoyl-CoA dioxygenase family protein [Chloroflexota bacterium]